MGGGRRVGDLEVGEDLDFQRREWVVQRVGWAVMGLIAIAGLLGLLGEGPLSRASAEDGPLEMRYPRFERKRAPMELRVQIAGGTAQQGQLELWLDEQFLDHVSIQGISPEPDEVRAGADRTVYVFQVSNPSQPVNVTYELEHDSFGVPTGHLGVVGGPNLEFRQIIYP